MKLCSFKALLWVLLLFTLTQLVTADEDEEGEEGEGGEEEEEEVECGKQFGSEEDGPGKCKCLSDELKMDAKQHCCLPHMINLQEGKEICFPPPTDLSLAVAGTLILSFSTIVSLQFWTGSADDDMKKYGYKVITSTISIFCAVLMFQCINGLIEQFIMDKLPEWFEGESEAKLKYFEWAIDMTHFLVWYSFTQLVLALASHALKPEDYRKEILKKKVSKDHKEAKAFAMQKLEVVIGCESYGVVCAHLTGFAAINAWTGLQQCYPFYLNPLLALVPVPICLLVQVILQWMTNTVREHFIGSDGEKDWFEDKWDEQCEDAENDVLGLTLSVMVVNCVRMGINGMVAAGKRCLPNQEQKEEGHFCEEWLEKVGRSTVQVVMLFVAGGLFASSLFFVKLIQSKIFPPKKEEEGKEDDDDGPEEEEEEEGSALEHVFDRFSDILIIALGMAFSWCTFHANKELLQKLNPSYLGQEENAPLLATVLALEVTYLGWMTTMVLDKISDLAEEAWMPPSIDASVVAVIDAIALFIGFAWEQTFDESVDSLASAFRKPLGSGAPAIAKFIFGSILSFFIFWSWKKFTIPFTIRRGWRFGYVYSSLDVDEAIQRLRKNEGGWEGKGRMKELVIELNGGFQLRAHPKQEGGGMAYRALPGSPDEAADQDKLLARLKQAEEEKLKAQQSLDQFTEVMLQSLQGINDTVTRIETA